MRYILLALVAFIIITASISGKTFITSTSVESVLPQLMKKEDPFAIFADMEKLVVDFSSPERPVVARPVAPARRAPIARNSTPTPKIATPIPVAVTSPTPSTPAPTVSPVVPVVNPVVPPVVPPIVTPVVPPVVPIIPPVVTPPTPPPPPIVTPPSPPIVVPPTPPSPPSKSYLGIPEPDGRVPRAIMPDLPTTGDTIQGFPYDPLNIPTPTYTGATNQYWVDGSNSACKDSGNGTPSIPRCTLPGLVPKLWTLAAGSQVFVAGDGFAYGGNQDINTIKFTGTASEPVWIIGVVSSPSVPRWTNQPKLSFMRFAVGDKGTMTHTFFHNVHFYSSIDNFRWSLDKSDPASTGSVEYVTLRHSTCSGSGTNDPYGTGTNNNARCLSLMGRVGNEVRFIAIYDNDIFGLGRWLDDWSTDSDTHGVQPQGAVYYVWYLKNRSYHLQGDSIQCNNSSRWDLEGAKHPHYIYIAGNEFYENYENAFDTKGCYHVVFSENYVHDFYNKAKGANASPIIAAQDGESNIGDRFMWFINNKLENVGDAVSYKGTAGDSFVYFLGNLVVNINEGEAVPLSGRCKTLNGTAGCGDGMFFAQNTIDCGQKVSAVSATRTTLIPDGEKAQELFFIGNIFLGCIDNSGSPYRYENANLNMDVTHSYNVDYRATGGPIKLQAPDYIDHLVGNLTNVNPLIISPTNSLSGNYHLGSGSTAIGIVPEPEPYSLFQSMYGMSIRKDLSGKTWSAGATLNAGAYQ